MFNNSIFIQFLVISKKPVDPMKFIIEATSVTDWLSVVVSPVTKIIMMVNMRMVRIAIMTMTRNLRSVVVVVRIAIKTSKAWWWWCRNWCNKVPSGGRPG